MNKITSDEKGEAATFQTANNRLSASKTNHIMQTETGRAGKNAYFCQVEPHPLLLDPFKAYLPVVNQKAVGD